MYENHICELRSEELFEGRSIINDLPSNKYLYNSSYSHINNLTWGGGGGGGGGEMDMKSQCIRSTKIIAVSAIADNDFPFIATMMLSCTHYRR